MLNAIEQGIITPSTKQRLEELEAKRKNVEAEIARESMTRPMLTEDEVRFWFERLRDLDVRELAHRKRLIDVFINSVFVYDDYLLITFNYPTTTKIVRFSDLDAAVGGSDMPACGRQSKSP